MKRLYILLLLIFISTPVLFAQQNTGIGTSTPDQSAILDISSLNLGFLIPRMSTAQINTISNPATGLTVYNTDLNYTSFYNGTTWRYFGKTATITNTINVSTINPVSVLATTIAYKVIPEFNQSITVTDNATVIIENNGTITPAAATTDAGATFALFVDGVIVNSSIRDVNALVLAGNKVTAPWQMLNMLNITPGTHTISIKVKYKNGEESVLNSGSMNIRVIN